MKNVRGIHLAPTGGGGDDKLLINVWVELRMWMGLKEGWQPSSEQQVSMARVFSLLQRWHEIEEGWTTHSWTCLSLTAVVTESAACARFFNFFSYFEARAAVPCRAAPQCEWAARRSVRQSVVRDKQMKARGKAVGGWGSGGEIDPSKSADGLCDIWCQTRENIPLTAKDFIKRNRHTGNESWPFVHSEQLFTRRGVFSPLLPAWGFT